MSQCGHDLPVSVAAEFFGKRPLRIDPIGGPRQVAQRVLYRARLRANQERVPGPQGSHHGKDLSLSSR